MKPTKLTPVQKWQHYAGPRITTRGKTPKASQAPVTPILNDPNLTAETFSITGYSEIWFGLHRFYIHYCMGGTFLFIPSSVIKTIKFMHNQGYGFE